MKKFDTAILYDIENLIGGYRQAEYLSQLSLKDIFDEIRKKDIGNIAIQRAYANWSDPRLNILRGDIVELGIEPIQMFGFGRGPKKNASDIQLAIDAVEIALTKPAIENFVIVSGDGGFSALAKKLHEYGKFVIGCAYRKSVNRVFEAVCDDFIWIDEPTAETEEDLEQAEHEFTNPILIAFAREFRPEEVTEPKEVFAKAREILNFFLKEPEARNLLENVGMNISIYSQALSYAIKDFSYLRYGFIRFVDFIRFVTARGKVKLVLREPSEYRLLLRDRSLQGFRDVEPMRSPEEIHTARNYRALLAKGYPLFILPNTEAMFQVTDYLASHRRQMKGMYFGDIVDRLSTDMDLTPKEIRNAVLALVNAECFDREPQDAKLPEQRLTFKYDSPLKALQSLRRAMHDKLKRLLGSVNEKEFAKILHTP